MAMIISTPFFPEPEADYARYSLTPEQLEGLIRVRVVETDSNSQVVWSDILVSVFCPCVSIAQISSSIGCSYFVSLLVFASIYLSGLGFLIQSVMEYMECDLNAEVVLYTVGLEIAAFLVGPYISLSTVGCAWFWQTVGESLADDPDARIIDSVVFIYACVDGWLDVVFVIGAAIVRDSLRAHVNAPGRRCCHHFLSTCCIWGTLGKGVSSAKVYSSKRKSCDVGPLDVIPSYADIC